MAMSEAHRREVTLFTGKWQHDGPGFDYNEYFRILKENNLSMVVPTAKGRSCRSANTFSDLMVVCDEEGVIQGFFEIGDSDLWGIIERAHGDCSLAHVRVKPWRK